MKKVISLVLTLCLLMMTAAFGVAETADGAAEALEQMENIKGTYEPLFPVITAAEYDAIWQEPCVKALGEEDGKAMADMMKTYCAGTIYGQEAIDTYGDGSNGMQFACGFINGVSTITFDGLTISGADEKGNQVFSHEYAFAGKLSLSGAMDGFLFETADEDAGEFKYFFMMPDTPATTYHLEFRYGSNVDDLTKVMDGPYAFWLAAGFPVDADAELINKVISLYCEENLEEMQEENAA